MVWFLAARARDCYYLQNIGPAVGPTQLPTQWVPGYLPPGVKWSECDTGHTPPYSVKVKITHVPLWHMQGQIYLYYDICKITFVLPIHWTCKRVIKDSATALSDVWILRNVRDGHQRARCTYGKVNWWLYIFKLGDRVPSTHWTGGWAPEPVWMLWREKSCCLYQEWNFGSSVFQSIAYSVPTMLSQLRVRNKSWTAYVIHFDRL